MAWLVVVEPALKSTGVIVDERRAAIRAFEALARRVERVQDLDVDRRRVELASIELDLSKLQSVWSSGVSRELQPVIEMRPIGPVLVLLDLGPAARRRG